MEKYKEERKQLEMRGMVPTRVREGGGGRGGCVCVCVCVCVVCVCCACGRWVGERCMNNLRHGSMDLVTIHFTEHPCWN